MNRLSEKSIRRAFDSDAYREFDPASVSDHVVQLRRGLAPPTGRGILATSATSLSHLSIATAAAETAP